MKKMWAVFVGIGLLLLGSLCGCVQVKAEEPAGIPGKTMEISFITIGKGDAFLLKMPEGSYYMYDTGKKEDFEQIQKVLEQKKVTSLKGIFLSHGHKDHAGNLKNLLEEYLVETVYISEKDQASYGKIDVEKITKDFDTTLVLLQGGEKLSLEGAEAKVWIPKTCDFRNANNNSVIIRFSYGKNSCLMTGNMEYGEEAAYLRSGEACKTDILKLGHHGESDATSVAFLEKVKPDYGWITGSEEKNPDSVNEEIAARLEAFETEAFYSEGEQLAWDFVLDGENITISSTNRTNHGCTLKCSYNKTRRMDDCTEHWSSTFVCGNHVGRLPPGKWCRVLSAPICGNFNCPCFDFYDFDGLDSIESGTFPWYAGFLVYRKIQDQY